LQSPDGKYLIQKEWREVYEFLCHSKVPKSWLRVFKDRDDLGNMKKEEAKCHWKLIHNLVVCTLYVMCY
jgi:hypothetical protein